MPKILKGALWGLLFLAVAVAWIAILVNTAWGWWSTTGLVLGVLGLASLIWGLLTNTLFQALRTWLLGIGIALVVSGMVIPLPTPSVAVTTSPATTASASPSGEPTPSPTDAPESSEAPSDGQAGIEDSNGELKVLPIVTGQALSTDTTTDPRTPATYKEAVACGPARNWAEFVECIGDNQWYIDGINARKSKTGFDWSDIVEWAEDTPEYDTRAIVVFNLPNLTDKEARTRTKELIGDSADQLPVVHRNTCIVNTRGFGHERMQDFVDCRQMVRVSLMPIIYDSTGDVEGLWSEAPTGIFVDCLNLWWTPKRVVPGDKPPTPEPTPTPTPTPPPTLNPKDPKADVKPPQGVTKLKAGKKTDGKESKRQKESGQTSGNVTDKKVAENTKSGDTTSDTGKEVAVPGATQGEGQDSHEKATENAVKEESKAQHDEGGTNGGTEIAEP